MAIICTVCKDAGLKSRVTRGASSKITIRPEEFYDEEGLYHYHDSNKCVTNFNCSNGHSFTTESYHGCPQCGDRWRGMPPMRRECVAGFLVTTEFCEEQKNSKEDAPLSVLELDKALVPETFAGFKRRSVVSLGVGDRVGLWYEFESSAQAQDFLAKVTYVRPVLRSIVCDTWGQADFDKYKDV